MLDSKESNNQQYKQFIEETVGTLRQDMVNLNEYFGTLKTQNDALMAAHSSNNQNSSINELRQLLQEMKDV